MNSDLDLSRSDDLSTDRARPTETTPLGRRLAELGSAPSADALLDAFLSFVAEKKLELYPAQEEAVLAALAGQNVVLNTPTGSGKSLVATALHFFVTAYGGRSFYASPIKALVSEKFFALCTEFGAERVGMMTGDASINRDAPIVCCTAEVLANIALREGKHAPVDAAILDEFHYYSDRDRGVAWQIPLLALPRTRFLLMSATIGDPEPFKERLTKLNGKDTAVVRSFDRPVPLEWEYRETPLHETVLDLTTKGRAPVYIVSFTQRGCAEEAQNLMSVDFCTKQEKAAIKEAIVGMRWDSPYGKEVQRFVRHGIGVHHAGLLPKYRLLVEKLAQRGLLKVVCGTDTLGVGVNIPIRTVLFTKLCKFDGEKTSILSVRDFQQISGRAGRKGFDERGFVVAQAPEHVIENIRLEAKAAGDPKKLRKLVRKRPPDKGYVPWDKNTFERLRTSQAETLVSRFSVSHSMILNVLERPDGGCMSIGRLIRDSHDRPVEKRANARRARDLIRSLLQAGIIEEAETESGGKRLFVHAELQEDFSLHHALSLYLVDTVERLDKESPTYALDLLSLVEAILENPDAILYRQVDKLKGDKMRELKAAGVEYEERMAELEKIDYIRPNAEFTYDTFNAFAKEHPWVLENIRPKSIARDMVEQFLSFTDYVREYGLERVEGLLLRYLSDVYKSLEQTVPPAARTESVREISAFLGAIVRQVDSSLIDEWERIRRFGIEAKITPPVQDGEIGEPSGSVDITRDRKAFAILVRNEVFRVVRALAHKRYDAASELLSLPVPDDAPPNQAPVVPWSMSALDGAMAAFWAESPMLETGAEARSPKHVSMKELDDDRWSVEQALLSEEGPTAFYLAFTVSLSVSRAAGKPVLTLDGIRSA